MFIIRGSYSGVVISKILDIIRNKFLRDKLKFFELTALAFFLIFLPSFEAPKNIFLVIFVVLYICKPVKLSKVKWIIWDWVFLSLILSAFLSAMFAGFSGHSEWKGFRAITSWILFGWILSRNNYNLKEKYFLFILAILATMPPFLWGLADHFNFPYFAGPIKPLALNSVGHVNHSAIYLCLIFGSTFTYFLFSLKEGNKLRAIFASFLAAFFCLGLIISQSRGALGVAILLSLILTFIYPFKVQKKIGLFLLLGALILSVIYFQPQVILKHEGYVKRHDILSSRDFIWRSSIEASKIFPIFGVGNGNYSEISYIDLKKNVMARGGVFNSDEYEIPFSHPHNIYLAYWVERGFFGLIVFLSFFVLWGATLATSFIRLNKNTNVRNEIIPFGSLSAFVVIFGVGLVNTTFHHENALLALFFLGLHLSEIRKK